MDKNIYNILTNIRMARTYLYVVLILNKSTPKFLNQFKNLFDETIATFIMNRSLLKSLSEDN